MTPQEFVVYTAGFFDGEGCVCITKARARKQVGQPFRYALHVVVAQTKRDILELMRARWGGHIGIQDEAYRRNPVYVWKIGAKLAAPFLTEIQPFVLVKAAQVRVALEFQAQGYGLKSATGEDYRREMWELNGRHGLHELSKSEVH